MIHHTLTSPLTALLTVSLACATMSFQNEANVTEGTTPVELQAQSQEPASDTDTADDEVADEEVDDEEGLSEQEDAEEGSDAESASSASEATESASSASETTESSASAVEVTATSTSAADSSTASADSATSASDSSETSSTQETVDPATSELSSEVIDALATIAAPEEILNPEAGSGVAVIAEALKGWSRIWGESAIDTMQGILQTENAFPSGSGGTVLIATVNGYWDALAAAGLAGTYQAPIVLTDGTALSEQAAAEVSRLQPARVVIVGGSLSVSDDVMTALKGLCGRVDRIWGENAPETAAKLYEDGSDWGDTAIIATSSGYWDALSVAPYAWAAKAPIFLSEADGTLSTTTLKALQSGSFKRVVIAGGELSVSADTEALLTSMGVKEVIRKAGADAIETSAEIARWELEPEQGMTIDHLAVATSTGYWDALSAAALCGAQNSVLVLVNPEGDYRALDAVYHYGKDEIVHGHVLGGTFSIPEEVSSRIEANWAVTGLDLSSPSVRANGEIVVTPMIEAAEYDPTAFSYNYVWLLSGTEEWGSDMKDGGPATKDTSRGLKFGTPGRYELFVDVFGPDGTKQTITRQVDVYGMKGVYFDAEDPYLAKADMGTTDGWIDGVEYRYYWSTEDGAQSGEFGGWTNDPNCKTNPESMAGWGASYNIWVEARDAMGSLGTASVRIETDPMTAKAQEYDSPTGWLVMVDEGELWFGIYQGSKGNWRRVLHNMCSCGMPGYNTPHGVFEIGNKGFQFTQDGYTCYYPSDYYLGSYAFHSVMYYPGTWEMMFGNNLGGYITHGCVQITLEDSKFLQDNVPSGSTVVIY